MFLHALDVGKLQAIDYIKKYLGAPTGTVRYKCHKNTTDYI